jgi:O-antigen/teichoic acid export membrane protein
MVLRPMIRSVRRRIWESLAASALSRAILVGYQLVLVPILLTAWGIDVYGEWLILTAFAAFAALSNVGFVQASAAEIVMCIGADDHAAASDIMATTFVFLALVTCAVFVIAVVGVSAFEPDKLFGVRAISPRDAVVILMFSIASVVLGFFVSPLAAAVAAVTGSGVPTIVAALTKIVELIGIGGVVLFGGGPNMVSVIPFISAALCVVVHFALVRRFVPWLSFHPGRSSAAAFFRLLNPSSASITLYLSVNLLGVQLPRIILGHIVGPAAVSIFSVSVTYARSVRMIATFVSQALFIELARAFGEKRHDRIKTLVLNLCQINVWTAAIGISVLMIISGPLFAIWTRGKVAVDIPLLMALSGASVISVYGEGLASFLQSINRIWSIALAHSGAMIVAIIAGTIATGIYGTVGMAAALIIPELAVAIAGAVVTSHLVSISPASFMITSLKWPTEIIYKEGRKLFQFILKRLRRPPT